MYKNNSLKRAIILFHHAEILWKRVYGAIV